MIFSTAEDMSNYLSRFGESNQVFKGDHKIHYRFRNGTFEKSLSPYKDKPTAHKYAISKSGNLFYFRTESNAIAGDDEYVIKLYKNQPNLTEALGLEWKPSLRSMVWMAFFPKEDPSGRAFVLCV
jgi:hypothetical protein